MVGGFRVIISQLAQVQFFPFSLKLFMSKYSVMRTPLLGRVCYSGLRKIR